MLECLHGKCIWLNVNVGLAQILKSLPQRLDFERLSDNRASRTRFGSAKKGRAGNGVPHSQDIFVSNRMPTHYKKLDFRSR